MGGLAIFLPGLLSSHFERKEAKEIEMKEQQHIEKMKEIESTQDIIEEPERSQGESEVYDENQMFFEGIEALYDYLNFGQVEDIKLKVQNYVHGHIDENILDCKVNDETIRKTENQISFDLEIENVQNTSVVVTGYEDGESVEVTILHSSEKRE